MGTIQIRKKIKGQKAGAIMLIFLPTVLLISYFRKNGFEIISGNNYVLVGSLIVLMICGIIGFKNSLRKEKELNKK
jgi:hypothetical protein